MTSLSGAVYNNDGKVVPVHDCKLEAYVELLELLAGEHCLTFYGYQHDRDRILERLERYNKGSRDKLRVRVYKGTEDEDVMATIRDCADTHEAVMRALKARIQKIRSEST